MAKAYGDEMSSELSKYPRRTFIVCSFDVFTLTQFNDMSQTSLCQTAQKLATFLLIFWSVILKLLTIFGKSSIIDI